MPGDRKKRFLAGEPVQPGIYQRGVYDPKTREHQTLWPPPDGEVTVSVGPLRAEKPKQRTRKLRLWDPLGLFDR